MMRPPRGSWRFIWRKAVCAQRNAPVRFVSMTRRQSASASRTIFSTSSSESAVEPVMVPHDCTDGFLYAYWRRPAAYLDPRIRKGSSSFWKIQQADAGFR